jgi:hypothetical protein
MEQETCHLSYGWTVFHSCSCLSGTKLPDSKSDNTRSSAAVVTVSKLHASRLRNDLNLPLAAAVSSKYSVAGFAARVLSCLHLPGLRSSCCTLYSLAVTLKRAVWWWQIWNVRSFKCFPLYVFRTWYLSTGMWTFLIFVFIYCCH